MRSGKISGWMRRGRNWLRMLIDPLWIPPEEMERARRELQERADLDTQARKGKEE